MKIENIKEKERVWKESISFQIYLFLTDFWGGGEFLLQKHLWSDKGKI